MTNKYPKKEKLKGKKLIEALFSEGKSIKGYPLKLIYNSLEVQTKNSFKAGVAVPKRNFKKAVDRNHIKRLLRESYRLNKHVLFNNSTKNYTFLFLYLGKEVPEYIEVEATMKQLLHKFLKSTEHAKID